MCGDEAIVERGRTCDVLHRIVVRARNSKELSKKKKKQTEKRERDLTHRGDLTTGKERERERKSPLFLCVFLESRDLGSCF